jgi:hypothetical protein
MAGMDQRDERRAAIDREIALVEALIKEADEKRRLLLDRVQRLRESIVELDLVLGIGPPMPNS